MKNVADENRLLRFLIGACSERFSRMGLSRSAVLCRGHFFISKILDGVSRLSETFLGDISDFSRRTGWSAVFSSCRVAALQASKPAAWDPLPDFRSGRVLNDFPQRISCVFGFRELDRDQFFSIVVIMGSLSRWMTAYY